METFNVQKLISGCCVGVGPLVMEKPDMKLTCDVPEDTGEADTDQGRLGQILMNLLSNAIKFTDRDEIAVRGSSGVGYPIVVLMPHMATLLCRNESRKCWPKTTPEYWVKKFYEEFVSASQDIHDYFYDNSDETEMETAMNLSRLIT